jgi:hypothetical protein
MQQSPDSLTIYYDGLCPLCLADWYSIDDAVMGGGSPSRKVIQ